MAWSPLAGGRLFADPLENAASIAGMLLTTECVLADEPEENAAPAMPAGMGGGMPGMM